MKYYRLLDDVNTSSRWFLGEIKLQNEWDIWKFIKVGDAPSENLSIETTQDGDRLDFTFSAFDVPIVNKRTADLFRAYPEVNLYPVTVNGESGDYYVFHLKKEIYCLDRDASIYEYDRSDSADSAYPQYKYIYRCKIDITKANNAVGFFRMGGYNAILCISDDVKKLLERNEITGIVFEEL